MKILIHISTDDGKPKKSALNAISYARNISQDIVAIAHDDTDMAAIESLGNYGVKKTYVNKAATPKVYEKVIEDEGVGMVIFNQSIFTTSIAPRLSVRLHAGYISNVISLPTIEGDKCTVKRGVFTGKAFAESCMTSIVKILSINTNIVETTRVGDTSCEVVIEEGENDTRVSVLSTFKEDVGIALPDAERVVSAGRGLKAPENWGMIEELAQILEAATACSKPVSDLDWRPHHEHVGQTGIKINPQLYIAIGISGAIQHLAGVNSSRVIVVINKDPEAPFFKSADYGVVGDAFEVVPKLISLLK